MQSHLISRMFRKISRCRQHQSAYFGIRQVLMLGSLPKWECGILRWLLLCSLFLAWWDPWHSDEPESIWVLLDCSESVNIVHQAYHQDRHSFYESLVMAECRQYPNIPCKAIFFGESAEWATVSPKDKTWRLPPPHIQGNQSLILPAIEMALTDDHAMQGRLVIVSDCHWQDTSLEQLLQKIPKTWEVEILPAIPNSWPMADASLVQLQCAPKAVQGSFGHGKAWIQTSQAGEIQWEIRCEGKPIQLQTLNFVAPGTWEVPFLIPITTNQRQNIQVSITPNFKDICQQNQHGYATVEALEPGPIVWIGAVEKNDIMQNKDSHFSEIVLVTPQQIPEQLRKYPSSTVIISQGTALELTDALPFLHDHVFYGGGLLMLGHESTLGIGGYAQTPLERALPVWCQLPKRNPIVLWIVLDVSGSMAESHQGIEKLQAAKQGIANICQDLQENDYMGLIAFRQTAQYVLPLRSWEQNRLHIASVLNQLYAQGSTNVAQGLDLAVQDFMSGNVPNIPSLEHLHPSDVAPSASFHRHLWMISDGLDTQAHADRILALGQQLHDQDVTISCIATGPDTHHILQRLVQIGQGRFYSNPSVSLSQQLQQEWQRIRHPGIKRGEWPVQTVRQENHALLPVSSNNMIQCLVPTIAKDWGTVLLQTPEDPLCVIGYYGQGRSAVWTSQFGTDWTKGCDLAWQQTWFLHLLAWLQKPPRLNEILCPLDYPLEYKDIGQTPIPPLRPAQLPPATYSPISHTVMLLAILLFLAERWLWTR